MQVGACGSLGNIASAAHAARAGDAGGVEAIVSAMRTHANAQLVQDHGLCALMALLRGDARNAVRAAEAGLVPLAVAAQRAWPRDEELVGQALVCVHCMARVSPALAAQALREGALGLAQRAVEALPRSDDVDGVACDVLGALVARGGGACADAVAATGAMERVVARIVAGTGDADTVDSRLVLLRALLAHGGAEAAACALRLGALPAMTALGVQCNVIMPALRAAAAIAAAPVEEVCALPGCGARARADGSRKKLQLCSACRGVSYCTPAHQREDWKRHKRACRAAAAASAAPPTAAAAVESGAGAQALPPSPNELPLMPSSDIVALLRRHTLPPMISDMMAAGNTQGAANALGVILAASLCMANAASGSAAAAGANV
jgi:hypothetical protein